MKCKVKGCNSDSAGAGWLVCQQHKPSKDVSKDSDELDAEREALLLDSVSCAWPLELFERPDFKRFSVEFSVCSLSTARAEESRPAQAAELARLPRLTSAAAVWRVVWDDEQACEVHASINLSTFHIVVWAWRDGLAEFVFVVNDDTRPSPDLQAKAIRVALAQWQKYYDEAKAQIEKRIAWRIEREDRRKEVLRKRKVKERTRERKL